VLAEPGVSAAVPLADWERISQAGRHFDRALTPEPPLPRTDNAIVLCIDAWLDIVDTTEPEADGIRGRVRRSAEDRCENGLANAYATQLVELAARLIPACGALDSRHWSLLASCAMLAGDRMSAALALNRVNGLRDPVTPEDVAFLFTDDARLDWAGPGVAGARQAAETWFRHANGDERGHFFPHRAIGETANRVRIEGVVEHWITDPAGESVLWVAPATLIFVLTPSRDFRIAQATVGAYARAQHSCDPGTLARRCH
jgi:hypothetical protein